MPVDTGAGQELDLLAAMPSDTIAVGLSGDHNGGDAVVIALQGRDGDWVAFEGTPEDARDLAFALLEKVNFIESRGYAEV
jgi:hypothetical protein